MASKLNPGADSVLVGAAYRAAAGNTPGDYSGTLEKAAESYEKTMEARSETWGNIAKLGANIGTEMIANANELSAYAAKTSGLDADAAELLTSEIYANKDAQKALGFLDFSRETRKERARLKLKQKELFAEIDLAVESINAGADAIKNGLYDAELANLNEGDAEKVNAIIKSNLKDRNTENRNYAKLGRDPNTGELMYTLYDSDTNEPTMLNGKAQTMTLSQFNKSIADNVKDTKNVLGTNLGTIENDVASIGKNHKTGVIDDQTKQLALNRLDGLLQTDTDLRRAMLAKYGYSNTSFIDDLNTKGAVSANLYGGMLRSLGLGEGGQIPAEGAFEGIADTDGTEGLSLKEVNAAYSTYVNNIIGMKDPEASKAAFKASFADRMDGAHTYGYSNRKIKPGGGPGGNGDPWGFGSKSKKIPGTETYVSREDRTTRRNHIKNNEGFRGHFGDYKWDKDIGGYILEGNTEKPLTKWKVMQQEAIVGNNDRQVDFDSLGVQKSQVAVNTAGEEVAGGVTLDLLDGNDDTVAGSLNSYIPANSNYSFRPAKSPKYGEKGWWNFSQALNAFDFLAGGEDLTANAVELVDGDNKPIMWKGQRLLLFTSSGGGSTESKNAQDAAVANFNDWLGQQNDFELQTGGNTGVGASEPKDVN